MPGSRALTRRVKRMEEAGKPKPSLITIWDGSFDAWIEQTVPPRVDSGALEGNDMVEIVAALRTWENDGTWSKRQHWCYCGSDGELIMDVKQAIAIAKKYIAEVFADEGVFNVGLEEVEFVGSKWEVTIGFSRKWDKPPRSPFTSINIDDQPDLRNVKRTYKIVEVDDETEEVLVVRNRIGIV